jgi:hypothetical protein
VSQPASLKWNCLCACISHTYFSYCAPNFIHCHPAVQCQTLACTSIPSWLPSVVGATNDAADTYSAKCVPGTSEAAAPCTATGASVVQSAAAAPDAAAATIDVSLTLWAGTEYVCYAIAHNDEDAAPNNGVCSTGAAVKSVSVPMPGPTPPLE